MKQIIIRLKYERNFGIEIVGTYYLMNIRFDLNYGLEIMESVPTKHTGIQTITNFEYVKVQ